MIYFFVNFQNMKLPKKIFFRSEDTTANLAETLTDKKTKEVSGRYVYETGFYFKGTFIVLPLSQIEKLNADNLIQCS